MTRKRILHHGITYAIGWIIANLVGAYVWPVAGVHVASRLVVSLVAIVVITALFYYWTSAQERPPDVDKSGDK